jgi:hypothetical protein
MLLVFTGCGAAVVTVTGDVTVNGTPLAKGVIDVSAVDTQQASVPADIVDGKYRITVSTGKKQVRISAPIVTGRRSEYNGPNAPLVETTAESIPAKYNSATELTWDVTKDTKTKDWSLDVPK